MTRWLGIDHGHKRIGLAVGSETDGVVSPLEVVPASPEGPAFGRIAQVAREYGVSGIVVGLPLNMDDTEGPQAAKARVMANELARRTGMDVRLWDERLSSFAADSALAGHMTRGKRKARQDALAAAEILRDFLSSAGPASAERAGGKPGESGS